MNLTVRLALVMTSTWLLLSGHLAPLPLALGAASVALVTWLAVRSRVLFHRGQPLYFRPVGLLRYWMWLLGQILLSNVEVTRRVLAPSMDVRPALRKVAAVPDTGIGEVVYANSITLTPGTTAIGFTPAGEVLVHALHEDSLAQLDVGEMARRVRAVEPDIRTGSGGAARYGRLGR